MTNYIQQAEKFLKDTNTIMEIIYDGMYSPRWDNKLHCAYKIKLQNEKGKYNFTFFDSLHNTEVKKMSLSEYLKKYKRINNINDISYNKQQKYNKELTKLKKESQPTYYNVLACLEKYDVGTLDDFMLEFGYECKTAKDISNVLETYSAVCEEYKNLCMLFNDEEMEQLREIY